MSKMPALFIGHGSPMNTLEANRYTTAWRDLGRSLPRPRAVLAISAHWFIQGSALTVMPRRDQPARGFGPLAFSIPLGFSCGRPFRPLSRAISSRCAAAVRSNSATLPSS